MMMFNCTQLQFGESLGANLLKLAYISLSVAMLTGPEHVATKDR